MKVAVIGVGRLGGALALALAEKKYEVRQLISRNGGKTASVAALIEPLPQILNIYELEKISSEIVFIAVPDPEIRPIAENLARKLSYRPAVFHTSGALSSDVLESLRASGCKVGSLHPLVSVSDVRRGAQSFKNAFFCVEGDEVASAIGNQIVADLGGNSFTIEARFKPLYHAAAVTSAGHLTALFSVAMEMLAACGLAQKEAQRILLPLAESAIHNLAKQTPVEALTGTFARADAETLKRHLEVLKISATPQALKIYNLLGQRSLDLAAEQGAYPARIIEMRIMLTESK